MPQLLAYTQSCGWTFDQGYSPLRMTVHDGQRGPLPSIGQAALDGQQAKLAWPVPPVDGRAGISLFEWGAEHRLAV